MPIRLRWKIITLTQAAATANRDYFDGTTTLQSGQGNDIQNPRWTSKYASAIDNVNRFFGSANVSYPIMDNMKLAYQLGLDHYSETQEYQLNKGSE